METAQQLHVDYCYMAQYEEMFPLAREVDLDAANEHEGPWVVRIL